MFMLIGKGLAQQCQINDPVLNQHLTEAPLAGSGCCTDYLPLTKKNRTIPSPAAEEKDAGFSAETDDL